MGIVSNQFLVDDKVCGWPHIFVGGLETFTIDVQNMVRPNNFLAVD